jgi:hypothetical protein
MSFGSFFLHDPNRFPAEPGGVPWGEERVDLALTGTRFACTGLSAAQATYVRQRYAEFLTAVPAVTEAPVALQVYRADPADFRPFDQRGWTYTLDLDYGPARLRVAGLDLLALLDWSPALSASLWTTTADETWFGLVFDNIFRLLSAYALLGEGGLLLHSAGISDGTWAWIGFGHSGAGKSTLAGLALEAGHRVLSDDLNVLRREAGRWSARRVPFAGTLGPTHGDDRSYPLAGLCRLTKGAAHRLVPLARPQALAALVASAPYVNRDPYRVLDLMTALESLLRAVGGHDLTFRKDTGFWPLLAAARSPSPLPSS